MLSSKTLKKKKDEKQKVQKNSTVENMDKLVNIIAKARKQMQRYENENYIADKIKNIRRYINDDVINIINIKTKTENINDKLMRMLDFMEFDIESRVRVPNDSSSKANATDNNDTSSVHETLSPTQRCLNLPEKSPSADIREMDEINSAITALNHDLDYLELLQEADSGFSGYCSNVRLMIYNRLRLKKQILDIKLTKRRIERINDMFKRSKMVHSIKMTYKIKLLEIYLQVIEGMVSEIDQEFDFSYPISHDVALFSQLFIQFCQTFKVFIVYY